MSTYTILERNKTKTRIYCKCLCQCGQEFTRREDYIKQSEKHHKPISCGCINRTLHKKGKNHPGWVGYGDLSGQYFSTIKHRAQNKKKTKLFPNGIPFEITIEYAWQLFEKQNGKCAISGADLYLAQSTSTRPHQTASLDRIDSTKGYIEGNVQWVHKNINLMKNTIPEEDFINWCKLVCAHNS